MAIQILSLSEAKKPADILFAGCFQKEKPAKTLAAAEPVFSKAVLGAIESGRFAGKADEIFRSYGPGAKASELVLLGLGEKAKYKVENSRRIGARMIEIARAAKAKRIAVLLETFCAGSVSVQDAAGALAEMQVLGFYDFDRYKSKAKDEDPKPREVDVELLIEKKAVSAAVQKKADWAQIVAKGVVRARDLINEPGNVMNPPRLAEEARKLAAEKKISCKILGLAELKALKMQGILAVNQGSVTPPALIVLEYGKKYQNKGTVCLVGKGVTFDTGGISIKPAKDMEKMKYDMAGAAAVIAFMGVAADLKIPVHIVALAPAVENNVAENPQRPGDIIRLYNGKTVEVINTDAEGRLILADALAYAGKFGPKAMIDLATLTGMCAYTFGDKAIGLLGNDEKLLGRVKKAGLEAGEKCWELPLWDEYAELIKGHHSDLLNSGGSFAGTITAAKFLQEFVPAKTPWAHLDIAGVAWTDSKRFDCPKGATGAGVRLLVALFSDWK
ncbi:MAG: leucyl aminopeptidase [Candidatus Omnitrophota bacterium]